MKTFLSILACALATSLFANVDNGAKAPDFTLPSSDGHEVALSDFSGKYVVLEWTNPHCPFVKKFYESGAMQAFQEQAAGMDVVWLTINSTKPSHGQYVDPSETVSYMSTKGVASTWLYDPAGDVGKLYGATNTPHMFIIDPAGKVIYQGAIDDKRSANTRDLDGAENYVMEALKAAMAGQPIAHTQTRPYGCSVKY